MNIFKQYGIKEIADVTLYSITRIGTEEFYMPVLFLDTLKVTTLDKSVDTVTASGGKGNGKLLSWNFQKDLKLKFEDALFSQMSMNTFLNGRVMAKMSDWTSAIAKCNVANKYGQKNYSIKAFPSPKLTAAEEEIIFRCAQKAGYDPREGESSDIGYRNKNFEKHTSKYLYDSWGQDEVDDTIVAENRYLLINQYYHRTQPTPKPRDISEFFDWDRNKYESISVILNPWQDLKDEQDAAESCKENDGLSENGYDVILLYKLKEESNSKVQKFKSNNFKFMTKIEKTNNGYEAQYAYLNLSSSNPELRLILESIFPNHFSPDNAVEVPIGDSFFLTHILYYLFPNYLEVIIDDLCWCDLRDRFYKAMPKKIIDEIMREIDTMKKVGRFDNDLYETESVERMERCVVTNPKGLKIDLIQQQENIKKMYMNAYESFSVFYDAKTMLPFNRNTFLDEKILAQKCIRSNTALTEDIVLTRLKEYGKVLYGKEWADSLTKKDFIVNRKEQNNQCWYITIIKHDYLTLKPGTVYYKWSRTIDEDVTEETFIGTDISIDTDTFSGEYMIVGETYIREQKTGKDQRYQVIFPRAKVSASTSIKLQASGDPTTFSLDVAALQPIQKNKSALILRQYDVEEDKVEGGFRIVPQNKYHTYTPFVEIFEQDIQQNNEIY